MKTNKLGNVDYIADDSGTATSVKCPLVDDWISPCDCMENHEVIEASVPSQLKKKVNWKEICAKCPFREY